MKKVSIILGTRPEAVKLCPLILAMQDYPRLAPHVCVTGQHREMLDQVLKVFGVTPDVDLGLMQCGQSLADLTARVISAVDRYLDEHRPDLVLVQGDTTTVLAASLAAFYRQDQNRPRRGRTANCKQALAVPGRNQPHSDLPSGRLPFCPHRAV